MATIEERLKKLREQGDTPAGASTMTKEPEISADISDRIEKLRLRNDAPAGFTRVQPYETPAYMRDQDETVYAAPSPPPYETPAWMVEQDKVLDPVRQSLYEAALESTGSLANKRQELEDQAFTLGGKALLGNDQGMANRAAHYRGLADEATRMLDAQGYQAPTTLERAKKTLTGGAKQYGGMMAGTAATLGAVEDEIIGTSSGEALWGAPRYDTGKLYEVAEDLTNAGAADVERAKEGLPTPGRYLVGGIVGAEQMGMDLAASLATGGNPMVPMMARSFGGGAMEAREKGYSLKQQLALGLANAATEFATEKLFGGNLVYDKFGELVRNPAGRAATENLGWVNRAIYKAVEKTLGENQAGAIIGVLGSPVVETLNEGWEEVIADIANPRFEQIITGNYDPATKEQLAESWATGVLTALISQGGGQVLNYATGRGGAESPSPAAENRAQESEPVEEVGGARAPRATEAKDGGPVDAPSPVVTRDETGATVQAESTDTPTTQVPEELIQAAREMSEEQTDPEAPLGRMKDGYIIQPGDIVIGDGDIVITAGDPRLTAQERPQEAQESAEVREVSQDTPEEQRGTEASQDNDSSIQDIQEPEAVETVQPTQEIVEAAQEAVREPAPSPADLLRKYSEGTGMTERAVDAMASAYVGGDLGDYFGGFLAYYNAGKNGQAMESVTAPQAATLDPAVRQIAYNEGQMEAIKQKPVAEAEPAGYTEADAPAAPEGLKQTVDDMRASLSLNGSFRFNGYEYTVRQLGSGSFRAEVRRTSDNVMGGMISNARGKQFSNLYSTREEAVEDLIGVAANNRLLENRSAAKEDEVHGNQVEEVHDQRGVRQSPARGPGDGGLLDGLAAQELQEAPGRGASGPVLRPDGELAGRSASGADAAGTQRGHGLGDRQREHLPAPGAVNDGLTLEERGAILAYKSSESYKINGKLNGGLPLSPYEESICNNLDTALEKLPVYAGTVYRNLGFDDFGGEAEMNEFLSKFIVGEPVTFHSYTSTSESKDGHPIDGNYIVNLVIEGKNGRRLAGYGNNSEQEVLFKRDAQFLPVDITTGEDGHPLITLIEMEGAANGSQGLEQSDTGGVGRNHRRDTAKRKGLSPAGQQSTHDRRGKGLGAKDAGGVQEQEEVTAPTVGQEAKKTADLAGQEKPRGNNFVIPASGLKLPNGAKARFKSNVQAIKTLRAIMSEGRLATPEEQIILSKYVGWGGIADAFDGNKADWAKEFKQLKGLLSEQEYRLAKGSTTNAHYTDVGVIRGIYAGLKGLGFTGGRLLEPSAGIGHFAGAMPEDLLPGVKSWTMVELDEITGNIAKYLYPNADVRVQGFEAAKLPDNYMDMAISNVPFGNYGIADRSYPADVTKSIHNYFFAKALDKVRPGGLVCFITSRYTMDSQDSAVRRYIMQRADLLGAIRLPDTAFQSNAGTPVVTDILVLKKREAGTPYRGQQFERTGAYHYAQGIYEQTNEYFQSHPEMVLGTAAKTGTMYRSAGITYSPLDTKAPLSKQIEEAFRHIEGKMDYPVRKTQEQIRQEIKEASGKGKNGSIVKKNGKLYKNNNGVLEDAQVAKANQERMEGIVDIRDAARALLDAQLDGKGASEIAIRRKNLNTLYDQFVKKNGPLNASKNVRLVKQDADYPFILALESWNKDTKTATKAAIFAKDTVTPNVTVSHVNTVEEGLVVSMNETGGVDAPRIAQLTGESVETVTRALLDSGLAFKNREGNLETAEQYLSGNVKAKLRDAEALAESDPDYRRNVEELKKIIPADVPAEDISVRPGATWIPDSIYSDFAAEMLGSSNRGYRQAVAVTYNRLLGQYTVELTDKWLKTRPENISTWGTPDRSFLNILAATLNNKNVTVFRKLADGGRILDKQATAAAQEKQEKILAEFSNWIWKDGQRKEALSKLYNDVFNNSVTPKYDGTSLVVNGANADKPLRPHQRDAVQRIISSGGNTLLAHRVGAGKTYEMAAAAMKLRQLGIVKKPMFVVPKSLVSQWGNEFLDFFPAAKVLVPDEKQFSAANRKQIMNQIAMGDYDAVIVSQEQFKALPMSLSNQESFYQEQIDALEMAILEAKRVKGERGPSVKQMEKTKKSFETKLKRLGDMKKDADNIDFEALGVDSLFVDEAHSYKNLFYSTNMTNVAGLGNKDGSQKAFDLYMKVRYLQSLNGGRGIVFATATPVMNSMSEMYIMQKYLQGDLLEAKGLTSFDAWANQFGQVQTVLEMNPSGKGFRQKQSFSRFKNLAELQQMFRAFSDVLTDIPGLKIPAMKTGKRIIVECEPSQFQMDYIEQLAKRADAIKGGKVDPRRDNMLKITSEGRKLSYTQRMIDPSLPYEEGCKILKCAQNVLDIWQNTKDTKGTQLIFCDLSTPKGGAAVQETEVEPGAVNQDIDEDVSIYDDIRDLLVSKGVPRDEIAFIHEAKTNDAKSALFQAVNEGKVRVLIGSTGKMGVGMNAQKKVVALHHLDAPWRPGDIEQREGRALRQGNENEEVGVYVYVTKQTFDSRMWDNLQRKASFIHQVMAGDLTARESEGDGDFALSAAEIKAISSGNPLIMEQFEVAAQLTKLENLERAHNKEVAEARAGIKAATAQISSDEEFVRKLRQDIAARQDTTGDAFQITIGRKTFTDRKAAGEILVTEAKKRLQLVRDSETTEQLGTFAGFDLYVTNSGSLLLRNAGQYRTTVNIQSPIGTVQALEAAPRKLDNTLATVETRLEENRAAIGKLERTAASPFDRADELAAVRKRNAEILSELNPPAETSVADLDEDTDDGTSFYIEPEDTETNVSYAKGSTATGAAAGPADNWQADRTGDPGKAPKRLSEIIEQIRHDFGINITKGHIRGKGIQGRYDKQNPGIRTRNANDIAIAAHELGHHFDNIYGILKSGLPAAAKKELVDNLDPAFAAQYPDKKKPGEGLAEYLRKYLQNRDSATLDYPEFTKHFKNAVSGRDVALLDQLANEMNAYFSADLRARADTMTVARDKAAVDARTVPENIKAWYHGAYTAWTDALHGIRMFDEATGANSYKLASNAAYADNRAGQALIGDLYDLEGRYVGPGLKTVLSKLDLGNRKVAHDFNLYLIAKHGPERLAEGLMVSSDPLLNDPDNLKQLAADLEAEHPEFRETAKRLYEFQRVFLQIWGVETGLISQETADEWGERWEFYVPFNRAVSKDKMGIGARRGFVNQDSTIRRARGSGLEIVHPLENIMVNMVKMVNAGIRNDVMRRVTNEAIRTGAGAEWLEQVPVPLKKTTFDMKGVKAQLGQAGSDALGQGLFNQTAMDAFEQIVANMDDILEQYGKGKAHGDVITVLKNGKQEFWKINDPLLLQSVTRMAPSKLKGVLDANAAVSRFMTSNLTGSNVIWSIFSNAPRDLMTMFFYSKDKNPAHLIAGIGSAYVNQVKGDGADPIYMEYLAMGGGSMSAYTADRDMAKKALEAVRKKSNVFSQNGANPLNWISFVSDTIEMGPRYATYKLCREAGLSPEEAFYEASDITVNFRRGGYISREVNKFIPFFNANVQGLDKFTRYLTGEDVPRANRAKTARGRTLAWFMASAALAALSYGLNQRDEEKRKKYNQLSNYTKNSYWVIPLADPGDGSMEGKYFAIPKPREIAVLSSFMETCMEFGAGNNHAFDEFYNYTVETCLPAVASDIAQAPTQGLVETGAGIIGSMGIIGVVGYLAANRDFLGKPIVSSGLSRLEPKDQYNARTSKIAHAIGQAFNVSPMQIDYFAQNVFGGWWKTQRALFPVGDENRDLSLGIYNTYVRDNQYSTDLVNWLYDTAEASERAKNSDKANMEKAVTAKMDDIMSTFYSRYYAIAKQSSESVSARGTRQTVLDSILEYRKARESGEYPPAFEAVAQVVEKFGDPGVYLPSPMQNYVKDDDGNTYTLSAQAYVDFQTDYLTTYWETVEGSIGNARNDMERAAIVKGAKEVAAERAKSRALARVKPYHSSNFDAKYRGVADTDIATFKALLDIANDDGKLTQDEVVDAIKRMRLNNAKSSTLFRSRYTSDKNNPWA